MKEELNKWLDACINDFADDVAEQFGGDTDRHPVPESVKNLPKATIKSKLDSQKAELIKEIRGALPDYVKDYGEENDDDYELGKRHGIIYEHNIFLDKVISVLANIERKQ